MGMVGKGERPEDEESGGERPEDEESMPHVQQ